MSDDNNPNRRPPLTEPAGHIEPRPTVVHTAGLGDKAFAAAETEARALSANRGDGQHSSEIMALEGRLGVLLARVADKDSLSPDEAREILQVSKTLEYQRRAAERAVAEQPARPERPTQGSFGRDAVHRQAGPAEAEYALAETYRNDMQAAVNRTMRDYARRGMHLTPTEATHIVAAEVQRDRDATLPTYSRVAKRYGL